jgi:hypothetical protein
MSHGPAGTSSSPPRTKAIVIPLRQLLYAVLALAALAIPALAEAQPCADHEARAMAAGDVAGILHAVVGTAEGSNPCPHPDQRPCKSTCGACVATPAPAPGASTPFAPSRWASAAVDPILPATAPPRLDRPPRR